MIGTGSPLLAWLTTHICAQSKSQVCYLNAQEAARATWLHGACVFGVVWWVWDAQRDGSGSIPPHLRDERSSIQSTIQSGKGTFPVPHTPTPSLQIRVWYESSSMGRHQCGLWVRLHSCSHFLPPAQTTVHFTTSVSVLLQWTVQRVGTWKDQSCGEKPTVILSDSYRGVRGLTVVLQG